MTSLRNHILDTGIELSQQLKPTESSESGIWRRRVEEEICAALQGYPGLSFSSLVVRRLPNGICLEGVLEVEDSMPDVVNLVQEICGPTPVMNRLIVNHLRRPLQPK